MKGAKSVRWLPILGVLLGFVQLQCLLIPDDTEKGQPVANQRPVVRITSGAATSDTSGVDYKVLFRWNGIDDDGVVARYEFAVDDTVSETAWKDTTGFSALLRFRSTTPQPPTRDFTDWHTFYLRAIDNEFAISRPDKRYFNSRTIAPTSEILFPKLTSVSPQLQRTIIIRWDGDDIDAYRADKKPVAFEFKLVNIAHTFDDTPILVDSLRLGANLLLDTLRVGTKKRWIRVPEEQRELKIADLPAEASLAFGVRAIDEAGAVEPELERGRNFIAFSVTSTQSRPNVTVHETSLGSYTFSGGGVGQVWDVSVPTNREIRFKWEGDAEYYGSLPGNVNYALDIPDVENDNLRDPQGIGGWIGWGRWDEVQHPFEFSAEQGGTIHNFWIKMRDISDSEASESVCQIRIYVVPFTFEKFALILDDAKFATIPPTDAEHDLFTDSFVTRRFFDLGDVTHRPMYPRQGQTDERRTADDIPLEYYAQFQHIFWNFNLGSVSGQTQGLYLNETEHGRLSSYCSAGGRLFMFGGRISGTMLSESGGDFHYPKRHPDDPTNPGFDKDSFIWKFMRYRNDIVSIPDGADARQQEASGLLEARSMHPAYPDLEIDRTKWDPYEHIDSDSKFKGGFSDWEGVQGNFRPIERLPGLDTLYTAVTFDTTLCCGHRDSGLGSAIIGQRYHSTALDTLAGTQQGRTIIFSFQSWRLEPGPLLDASTAAINWLVTGEDH